MLASTPDKIGTTSKLNTSTRMMKVAPSSPDGRAGGLIVLVWEACFVKWHEL